MILRLSGGILKVEVQNPSFSLATITLTSLENTNEVTIENSNNTTIYDQAIKQFVFSGTNVRGYHILLKVDGVTELETIVLDENYLNTVICSADTESTLLITSLVLLRDLSDIDDDCNCNIIDTASNVLNTIITKTGTCNDC